MAMPNSILDMRFNQNPDDLIDDEPFLQAMYRASVQVEKKKALKSAKEAMRTATGHPPRDGRKDGKKEGSDPKRPSHTRKGREEATTSGKGDRNAAEYGQPNHWTSEAEALQGVPITELREHRNSWGCHRCGKSGYRAARCYASTTMAGTRLVPAPWKIVAAGNKRRRGESEESEESAPAAKQQKIGAVETMGLDPMALWDEESDF